MKGERLVQLIDGRMVSNCSEDWRLECEARAVLAMPTPGKRRRYLRGEKDHKTGLPYGGVVSRRGEESTQKLEAKIMEIWNSQRASM